MDFARLIALGNNAKSYKMYDFANIVTAMLIQKALDEEPKVSSLLIEIETQEPDGQCPEEAYYDLILISLKGESEGICIPVPLLNFYSAIACYKRAASTAGIKERGTHARKFNPSNKEQEEGIWQGLLEEIEDPQLSIAAIQEVMDECDEEGNPLAQRLIDLLKEKISYVSYVEKSW